MENQLDMISEGNREWKKTVDECYKSFIPQVNKLMTNKVDEENKVQVVRNRLLGKLKGTDKEIWALIGKYGPVLRVGKGKTVKFYNLKKCKKELNDITLADSLEIINNYDK
jgi:DNA topoisomerase-1